MGPVQNLRPFETTPYQSILQLRPVLNGFENELKVFV